MKVTFNAKKDAYYNVFVRGIVVDCEGITTVSVKDQAEVTHAYLTITDQPKIHAIQMNFMVRSGWEGLTTLWLYLENGTWYFSENEAPSIQVRKV